MKTKAELQTARSIEAVPTYAWSPFAKGERSVGTRHFRKISLQSLADP